MPPLILRPSAQNQINFGANKSTRIGSHPRPTGGGGGFGNGFGDNPLTDDGFYIYTHEPVDADTVLADDFSRGAWYTYTADDVIPYLGANDPETGGGYYNTGVHGWVGTIYNGRPTPTPSGAVELLGNGDYTATAGVVGGDNTANMADHNLKYSTNEVWLRFYTKPSADYDVGSEKMVTFNSTAAGNGGISIGNAGSGRGIANWDCCPVYDCNGPPNVYYYRQNQGAEVITTPGRWQFVEMHVKMNTPGVADGIWELWLDDCGDGTFPVNPVGSPTLKAQHLAVQWQGPTDNKSIVSIWFENWSNPISSGSYKYTFRINANRAHALGFATV